MLSNLRAFAKSPWAAVIIVLLVLSFAVYGVGGIFTGSGTAVVVVGNEQVSSRELSRAFQSELRQIQMENPTVTNEQAIEMGLPEQTLQRLITQAAFSAKADDLGLEISDDAMLREARTYEAFRSPVTGEFDAETMAQVLAQNSSSPEQFRDELASSLRIQQLVEALSGGIAPPPFLTETRYQVGDERREMRGLIIDASTADEIAAPTDEELQSFIENNPDMAGPIGLPMFTAPEFRAVTLVRFRVADFARDVEIEDEVLRETYDYQVETGALGTPAIRSFVRLNAPDEETANTVVTQLEAGAAPADIAAELGLLPPERQDEVQAYEVPDEALADTVFAMAEGEVRAFEGRFGWSAVQVTLADEAAVPSFEEQRPTLQQEAAQARAIEALYDQVSAFEAARATGATLEEAARQSGSPIEVYAPMDRYARYEDMQIDMERFQALGPDILTTAFEQPQGFPIDLQQYNETDYFTVRVDAIVPERLRDLSEVREEAEARWRQIQVDTQLQVRADDALAQLEDGADMDTVAIMTGARAESATLLRSETAGSFDRTVVARAFGLAEGEWAIAQNSRTGQYVVITVDDIIPGDVAAAEVGELGPLRENLAAELENDVLTQASRALREEYEVSEDAINRRLFNLATGQADPSQP